MPPTGEILLSVEGMEALRLSDHEGMDQDGAAVLMGVSRQTYGRILAEAREAVAHALVTGKVLRVEGGNYQVRGGGRRRMRRRRQLPAASVKGGDTMPRGDGTGPDGRGPLGRGSGGRGQGRGRGNAPGGGGRGGRRGKGSGMAGNGGQGRGK
jgi:predicted DNA-binding protein (UPF0251 family)